MYDKVTNWRCRRINRRCKYCTYSKVQHVGIDDYEMYTCIAKDKYIRRERHSPFCKLFTVKLGLLTEHGE